MKKPFLFFIMTVLLVGPGKVLQAQLQEVTTLDGWMAPQNALARQYTNEKTIYYFDDGPNHYFVLQDNSIPNQVTIAEFFPFLEVHDFEIYQNIVYFCGKFPNSGNPYGIVGFIKVDDLFYFNGPYNMSIVNNLTLWGYYTNTPMTSCDRMDLFVDYNGLVHMAIVGELVHGSGSSALRRTFADIWFNGSDWIGNVMYQKDDLYKPTDITCTDDAVVITAYDDDNKGAILLVYKKDEHFPSLPVYSHVFRIDDPMVIADNVLVERLNGNDVVVTNHFQDPSTGDYGTALHYIPDVINLPNTGNFESYHIIHGVPYGPQMDIRYNKNEDRLLLLHDIDYPQLGLPTPTFFSFMGYNLPSLTLEAWFRPNLDIKSIMSIDNRLIDPQLSLGGIFGPTAEPLMGMKNSPDQGCYDFILDNYTQLYPNFFPGRIDEPYMDFFHSNIILYTNSYDKNTTIHCSH